MIQQTIRTAQSHETLGSSTEAVGKNGSEARFRCATAHADRPQGFKKYGAGLLKRKIGPGAGTV